MQPTRLCPTCGWRFFGVPEWIPCPKCGKVEHHRVPIRDSSPAATARPSHWPALHQYPVDHSHDWSEASAREFYDNWCSHIPGFDCGACAANWDAYTVANPPDFASAEAFFAWGVHAHNHVSVHHVRPPKPAMTLAGARLAYWPKPRGYCDPHFVAVTSLAPRDCPRQQAALNSWSDFGLTVHAVNTASEIEILRPLYQQVDHWHANEDQAAGLSKRTATINSLADIAVELDQTILLINADCETYGDPSVMSNLMSVGTLAMGIRRNYPGDRRVHSVPEVWGLDAFVVTPSMAQDLPRLPFGIGLPVWDYWLPLHFQQQGYAMVVPSEPWLYHKSHHLAWSQDDWLAGAAIIQSHYDYPMQDRSSQFRKSLPFPPDVPT